MNSLKDPIFAGVVVPFIAVAWWILHEVKRFKSVWSRNVVHLYARLPRVTRRPETIRIKSTTKSWFPWARSSFAANHDTQYHGRSLPFPLLSSTIVCREYESTRDRDSMWANNKKYANHMTRIFMHTYASVHTLLFSLFQDLSHIAALIFTCTHV